MNTSTPLLSMSFCTCVHEYICVHVCTHVCVCQCLSVLTCRPDGFFSHIFCLIFWDGFSHSARRSPFPVDWLISKPQLCSSLHQGSCDNHTEPHLAFTWCSGSSLGLHALLAQPSQQLARLLFLPQRCSGSQKTVTLICRGNVFLLYEDGIHRMTCFRYTSMKTNMKVPREGWFSTTF